MANVNISPLGGASVKTGPLTTNINPLMGSGSVKLSAGKDFNIKGGAGIGPSGVSLTPTAQIGHGTGPSLAASGGGVAGGLVAGPVGSLAGSAAASAGVSILGNLFSSSENPEHKARDSLRNSLQLGDQNHEYILPDGTTANFSLDAHQGTHAWTDSGKAIADGNRSLYSYDTDYTNDLDYLSSMGGISLSRMLAGGKNQTVDQLGSQIGNQALGKSGYNASLDPSTFNDVMTNMRSIYANKGVKTKDEMLGLANKMYSDGRINETDHQIMEQTANMLFDNNYSLAQNLMSGRWNGLKTASETPVQTQGNQASSDKGHSMTSYTFPSYEEVAAKGKPYFDYLRSTLPKKNTGLQTAANVATGFGMVGAGAKLFNVLNDMTHGAIGKGIKGLWDQVAGSGNQITDTSGNAFSTKLDVPFDTSGVTDAASTASDNFQLPDTISSDVGNTDFQLPTDVTDLAL